MSRKGSNKRKAVAPVLATLLMIAVAVAMSVIIFMWSQGFLSQTSQSTGSQQGSQNQAAQSSIAIEIATFTPDTANPSMAVVVRNVGAVAVTLGSITVTGISSNSGFQGSLVNATLSTTGPQELTSTDGTWTYSVSSTSVEKGASSTLTLTGATTSGDKTVIKSGDVITIKITTTAGTFAQASYTVP